MLSEGVKYIFSCSSADVGFKQHSSSCTSSSQQYLATTAKRGLSFISMLSLTATLKTFAVFNAIVCCLFTSLAMSVMRLSIVRAETGLSWICYFSCYQVYSSLYSVVLLVKTENFFLLKTFSVY